MTPDIFSNIEFTEMKNRINDEIKRRGGYSWWDPLSTPTVGTDRSKPLSTPTEGKNIMEVDDKTYTINNPSEGSIEPTRNIKYPAHGENPGGEEGKPITSSPNTSAAAVNLDEMKNLLVGLSKIKDINLFYGRDEIDTLGFRDPNNIEEVLSSAESDLLNKPLNESDVNPVKNDPNGGLVDVKNPKYPVSNHMVVYPRDENGRYIMPSGEMDGEEGIVGEDNFFDDFGALPGDGDFHPFNRHVSNLVCRNDTSQDNKRNVDVVETHYGNQPAYKYGENPRNPQSGTSYAPRLVYGGMKGTCHSQCTGLCYTTCDNECNESCYTTCWNRCGEACTSSCGNLCTGCSTMCYTSCKTRCENVAGYACLKAGARAVKLITTGGKNGILAANKIITYPTYSCMTCDYSCQFYPNKKTECWDAGCMNKCFVACNIACSESCYGGCIGNDEISGKSYKTGKGKGCSAACTLNCIGECLGVCEGYCVHTCFHACQATCSDNCVWICATNCGNGCMQGCRFGCVGCTSCTNLCIGKTVGTTCVGCSTEAGCTSMCRHNCDGNCVGWGCRSLCGIDSAGACEANCRLSCMGTSCTSQCSDACSNMCTTCVNTCGWQCGACSSFCSAGCENECNYLCIVACENSCDNNCVHSCSEVCGGCSDLCYSCVAMCIGICSLKCEYGCSSCSYNCSYWCDIRCNQACFSNCSTACLFTCINSCISYLFSDTTYTAGPERPPTSQGYIYPNPSNRFEERDSFKIFRYPTPFRRHRPEKKEHLVNIYFDEDRIFRVDGPEGFTYVTKQSPIHGGVYDIDKTTGETTIAVDMLPALPEKNHINMDGGWGIFIVIFSSTFTNKSGEVVTITDDDIGITMPFGFKVLPFIHMDNGDIAVIIERDQFLFEEEEEG